MSNSYAVTVVSGFEPDIDEPLMDSLFSQYERVIIESIISSFGLDFLIKDSHGGDVDTIYNVRQIGKDDKMTYKNKKNEESYQNRGEYNSAVYHSDKRYIDRNRKISAQKKAGNLKDAYTLEHIPINGKTDQDHVISAKEIHEDRGRDLARINGVDLANSDENLQATNPHTNRTKKADSMREYLEKHGDEYTKKQKANMQKIDATARRAYEQKLARAYYMGPKFRKDVAIAAGKVGFQMGVRQALGFVFTEIWFCIKDEFGILQQKIKFDLKEFLQAIGKGIKRGWESAKVKFKELFSKFLNGAIGGVLASLTTTLCNIFFTTAKNAVRIIRQAWASLVEALKILLFNPDGYLVGDKIRAAAKMLATGASVVAGTLVAEAIGKTGIDTVPVIGEIVQSFCGAFVSGILSCTFLYFLDRDPLINKLIEYMNDPAVVAKVVAYYKQQVTYFEEYAAKLMKINIEQFRKETAVYINLTADLESAGTGRELNMLLYKAAETIGFKIPWGKNDNFDSFMQDKNVRMVFE